MKKYMFIITLVVICLVACTNSAVKEILPLEGEWNMTTDDKGSSDGYIFKDGTFIGLYNGKEVTKGSYTVNGSEITISTEMIKFSASKSSEEKKWFTRDELVKQYEGIGETEAKKIHPKVTLDYFYSTMTFTFSVDEDVLTLKYPTALDEIYLDFSLEDYKGDPPNMTTTPEWVSMMYQRVKSSG